MASLEGHVEVMKKLIVKGADINAFATADDLGSILNGAISSGNLEAVELLINEGVELSFPEEKRSDDIAPPLAEAARTSIAIFDLLMSEGAGKFSAYDYDKAFVYAAANGQSEILEKLLEHDHPQETYQLAIERAVEEDEWAVVKMMLEKRTGLDCHQAFVKAAISLDDHTDILYAVWKHTEQALPQEVINEALYEAANWEKIDIVRVLLNDFGADPNAEAPVSPVNEDENTSEQQENHDEDGDATGETEINEDETENNIEDDENDGGDDELDANEDGDGGDDESDANEDGDGENVGEGDDDNDDDQK